MKHKDSIKLYVLKVYLSPVTKFYVRNVYGLHDVLSSLGGMMSVIYSVTSLLMIPIAKHMYYLIAIKRLFLAKTSSSNFLMR